MTKKTVLLVLIALLTQASFSALATETKNEEKVRKETAKVQAAIAKLGIGESARAEVKLRDKTKFKGYVRSAGDKSFELVNARTGDASTIEYSSVKQVRGNNLSTGAKIAIGLGIAAGVIIFIALLVDD